MIALRLSSAFPSAVCTCAPGAPRLAAQREHYETTRDKSLVDVINSETSGDYELFVLKLLRGERDESGEVDEDAAATAAEALYKGGVGNWWGTDEEVFVETLVGSNPAQVKAIMTAYENAQGKSLESAIKHEFGSDAATGLLAMLVDDRVDYLAKVV